MLNPAAPFRAALRLATCGSSSPARPPPHAGDWLYNLALLALVYDRTGSSTWLGVTTAARSFRWSSSARSAASSPIASTAGG